MADNATSNPGVGGVPWATDEIAGIHWPYAKLAFGPRDTANEVDDAATKRVPVKVGQLLDAGAVVAAQFAVTAGDQALPAAAVRKLTLRAMPTNAGAVYVGGVGVTVAAGFPLVAGDPPLVLYVSNANVVHVIAAGVGNGVAYIGEV